MFKPTVKHTIKPGPAVAAIPSISFNDISLSSKAFLIINSIFSSELLLPTLALPHHIFDVALLDLKQC